MYISTTAALFLKENNFETTIVRVFVEIISIPDEELLSETGVGCTAS